MSRQLHSAFLAEDHPPTRDLLSKMLGDLGIRNQSVFGDGSALLKAFDSTPAKPDLVFSDLQMPKVDGLQLIRELSSRQYDGGLFLVTGQDRLIRETALHIAQSYGHRSTHVITKPISKPLLMKSLELHKTIKASTPNQTKIRGDATAETDIPLDSFVNYYQPKIQSLTGEIIGAEALIRMGNPRYQHLTPDIFIPVIERNALIQQVTLDVIHRAAQDLVKIKKAWNPQFKFAINLSAECLVDYGLPDRIAAILSNHGVSAGDFIFEITESKAVDQPILAMEVLGRLRMMGAELSIDDFGTGFSSLKQLLELPFSELKVDRSFVTGAWSQTSRAAVMRSALGLAKQLGIRTVAEGIETTNDMRYAIRAGADVLQGYFISKPMPFESLIVQLNGWDSERKLYWEMLDIGK